MHDQGAQPLRFFAQHARGMGVHGHGQSGLGFGPVNRGMGGRIHNHIRARLANQGAQGLWPGKVALRPVQRQQLAQRRQGALQLKSHLAVFAGQQDTHQLTSD